MLVINNSGLSLYKFNHKICLLINKKAKEDISAKLSKYKTIDYLRAREQKLAGKKTHNCQ